MPAALIGAASCVRCGGALDRQPDWCPRCGITLVPAAPGGVLGTYAPLLAGVSRARVGRRRWAWAIDAAPIAAAAVVAVVQIRAGRADQLSWTLVAVLVCLLVQAGFLIGRGLSLGRLLLDLRTVDDLTGLPVSARTLLSRLSGRRSSPRVVTADLAAGRDPLDLALPAVPAPALADGSRLDAALFSAGGSAGPSTAKAADAVTLVFDTGRRQVLHGTLLIGRSPENKGGSDRGEADHPLLGMADLSRTLAKTHALLEWSGSVLWVTDLNSAHGSVLVSPDGERRSLVPGIRGAAAIGWTVHCGKRFFSVHGVQPGRDT